MLPLPYQSLGPDGTILDVNQRWLDRLGYSRDEVIGRWFSDFLTTESQELFKQRFEILKRKGMTENVTFALLRKDGTAISTLFSGTAECAANGRLLRTHCLISDVTKLREAERALLDSEGYLKAILDSSPDYVLWLDRDLRIRFANRAAPGLTLDDLLGNYLPDLAPESERPEVERVLGEALATGSPGRYETTYPIPDEGDIFFESSVHPLRDLEADEINGLVVVSRDISARKRAEMALSDTVIEWQTTFDASSDSIWLLDADHRIRRCNRGAELFLDSPCTEQIGGFCWELVHGTSEPIPECPVVRAEQSLQRETQELQIGEQWIQVTADPILARDGTYSGAVHSIRDITERKTAQAVLREERDKAQQYLDVAGVMFVAINREGIVTLVNQKGCEILGYDEGAIVGKPWFQHFIPERLREPVAGVFDRLMRGDVEPVERHENPIVTRGGDERIIAWHNTLLRDRLGEIIGSLSSGEDVTERRQAEKELRKLAAVVEHTGELVNLATMDGQMVFLNEAGGRMLGIDPREVQGVNIMEVIPESHVELVTSELLPALVRGDTWEGDLQYRNLKTGNLTDVRAMTFTIKDPDTQEPLLLANVSRDVTERKRAEEELSASEKKFSTITEGSADAIFVTDRMGNYTYVNQAACELLGYSSDEFLGMSIVDLAPEGEADSNLVSFGRLLETGRLYTELELLRKDGSVLPVDLNAVLLPDGLVYGSCRDLTNRRAVEASLRQALENSARGQRLLLSLSEASSAIQRVRVPAEVFESVYNEIAGLGYNATLFTLTEDGRRLKAEYMTFDSKLLRAAEKLTRLSAADYSFEVASGSFFEGLMRKGEPVFSDPGSGPIADALPRAARPFAKRLARLLGVDRAIYAPLTVEGKRYGLMTVMGSDLSVSDIPAISAFGNQTAIAVENARAYRRTQQERDRAQQYLDIAAVMLVALDSSGAIMLVNRRGSELLGRAEDELLGSDWFETCVPARLRVEVREFFDRLISAGTEPVEPFENPILAATGEERLIAWQNVLLRDESGSVIGVLSSGEDITDRRRAEEQLRENAERLRDLRTQLERAEEDERRRIARELHDQVSQNLTALSINASAIRSVLAESAPEAEHRLAECSSLIEETAEHIRDLTFQLRPPVLDDFGLISAIEWHAERVAAQAGMEISVKGEEPEPRLAASAEMALFRIVQEALTNVAKHARAKTVSVGVEIRSDSVALTIEDDGVGFDPVELARHGTTTGWGLLNMRERVEALGGAFTVESSRGRGCRIAVEVPR